jgi:integrase
MDLVAGGVRFQLYPLERKKGAATLICYQIGSKRERETFKGDLAAAQKHCKSVLCRKVTSGEAAIHQTPLDNRVWTVSKEIAAQIGRPADAIIRDHAEAVRLLAGRATVLEAVRDYCRRQHAGYPSVPVSQVVEELLAALTAKRRAESTVKSLRIPLRAFAAHFSMPIADVQTSEIERWLQLYPQHAPRTLNNWSAAVTRLFNFAKGRYLPVDLRTAADALESVTDDARGAVQIFQPWELSTILALAPDRLRPFIALGAFAGLRTIELHRLDWSAVHFQPAPAYPHGFIEVRGSVAKQHRAAARRIIPMQPNLAAWLEAGQFKTGRISHYATDKAISDAITKHIREINTERERHKQPPISRPDNGLRHSYGSYRLPVLGSVDALALEMNNSPQEIFANYREVVHPDRVPDYWSIAPQRAVIEPIAAAS